MKWDRVEIAKFLGSIGAALLVAGYLRYSIQAELLLDEQDPADRGRRDLVLAAIVLGFGGIAAFFSKRSSKLGTNTSILTLGVIAILVIVNFLGYQHHKRFDLTTEKLYTLSDQTKKIVGGLKNDVNIVRFAKTPDPHFDELMTEYHNLNPAHHISERGPAGKAGSGQGIRRAAHRRRDRRRRARRSRPLPPNPEAPTQRIRCHQRDPESHAGQGEDRLLRHRPRRKRPRRYPSQRLQLRGPGAQERRLQHQVGQPGFAERGALRLRRSGDCRADAGLFPAGNRHGEQVSGRRRQGAHRSRSADRSEAGRYSCRPGT